MKKKKEKLLLKPGDYESVRYGPLKIERIGRVVQMSSSWDLEEHKKFLKKMSSNRPKLKKQIDKKINQLITLLNKYNALHLLPTISFKNVFANPEEYKETTFEGKEVYIEYALSLAVSQKELGKQEPKENTQKEFQEAIKDILKDVEWYFLTEDVEARKPEKADLKSNSLLRFLFVRGDSFPEHHFELVRELFGSENIANFFKKHYGFIPNNLLETYDNLEKQLNTTFKTYGDFAEKTKTLHKLFINFSETEEAKKASSLKELRDAFHDQSGIKEKIKEAHSLNINFEENPFEVKPQNETEKRIYKEISCLMGENPEFTDIENWQSWPTNNSIIYRRPLLLISGKYHCFAPSVLFRNLIGILENFIATKDKSFFDTQYINARTKFLEGKSLQYFVKLLPEARIYKNLFYSPNKSTSTKAETDSIILYDNSIFIIEVKSGRFSLSAQRGSIERIKRDVKDLVDSAYYQAIRTKEYIEKEPIPVFYDGKGSPILKLENKSLYENIFIINVTLDPLNHISTQLNSLKQFNFLKGKEWPWSVFINDLRVISDIIESPTEFLLFLQRRIRANDFPQFRMFDELDFLMFFFKDGLFFEEGLGEVQRIGLSGYTQDLDRYYDYIAGRVSTGDKPRMNIRNGYRNLIQSIEVSKKHGKTRLSTILLGLSGEAQKGILDNLEKIFSNHAKNKETHDFSLFFDGYGLTFIIPKEDNKQFREKMERFCKVKKYGAKFDEWFLIIMSGGNLNKFKLDFESYRYKWTADTSMENNFKVYKLTKWRRMKLRGEKINRNDPCFCGSGKKYKKCCYLLGFS